MIDLACAVGVTRTNRVRQQRSNDSDARFDVHCRA
jgi:hypothetical protein